MVILCVFSTMFTSPPGLINSEFYNLEMSYNVECCTPSLSCILMIDTLKLNFVVRKNFFQPFNKASYDMCVGGNYSPCYFQG